MSQAWYDQNTHLVVLDELKDAATGAYINAGATVTADAYDVTAAAVLAGSAITLSYVAASNGKWQATMPSTVALTATGSYLLRVKAISGGAQGWWTPTLVLKTRE